MFVIVTVSSFFQRSSLNPPCCDLSPLLHIPPTVPADRRAAHWDAEFLSHCQRSAGRKAADCLPWEESGLQGCTIIRQSTGDRLFKMRLFIASLESRLKVMLEVTPRMIWMQGTVRQWGLSDRCHPTEPLYWKALKSVSNRTTSLHKGGFQRAPEPSLPNSSCSHYSEALCALCNRVVGRYLLTEATSRARSHRDIACQPRSTVALTWLHGFQRSW